MLFPFSYNFCTVFQRFIPSFSETDAAHSEPGIFHHHGRSAGHPGSAQEQLRDPDHAAEAGHISSPASCCRLRVHAVQRQKQEGQLTTLQVQTKSVT